MIFTSINAYSAGSYQDTFHIGLPFSGQDVFLDLGDTGAFKWDVATSKLQFSNDGASYTDIGVGGSGGGVDEWVTATDYVIGNIVWESPTNSIYRALTIHTSSVFATDLANGDWQILGDGVGLPLMAKGSLIGSNGTNNGEFAKCPDGEFLIWDDSAADGTGMVCSGTGVKFGIDVDATFTNILHMNKGSGVSKHSGMFMYMDGSTSIGSYLYHNASGKLYLGTSSSVNNVAITAGDVERLTINGTNGAVVITDTGGNGGNVPHQCLIVTDNNGAANPSTASCPAGKIAVGCGWSQNGTAVTSLYLTLTTTSCVSGVSGTVTNHTAMAMCCKY